MPHLQKGINIMKQTTIDTSLMPKIWLTWTTTKATFYLDCETGKKQDTKPDVNFNRWQNSDNAYLLNSGSKPRYAYVKYHEDIDMLEFAEATIDTTRKEEPKQWRYVGEKYFMKKNKTVVDANGDAKDSGFVLDSSHRARTFKEFLGMIYRISYKSNADEFKKFLGAESFTIGSGRVIQVTHCWHIQEWYKTSQKVRKHGKQHKLATQLTSMPVKDAEEIKTEYAKNIASMTGRYSRGGIIYFENLTDGWHVLRVFKFTYNDKVEEYERMYLHDDGSNRIVAPSKNGWIPAKQMHTWCDYVLVNEAEATEKCKRLKYILPHVKKEPASHMRNCLLTILRFPELEQIISLGYGNTAMDIANSDTPKAHLKYIFGEYYNEKETSILRKVGLTKYQFDAYMRAYNADAGYNRKPPRALGEMRNMFGGCLTHLDNNTFYDYLNGFIAMDRGWGRKPFDMVEDMGIDRAKFIKNAFRLGKKNATVYTVLDDTLRAYNFLNRGTQPEINWYFDSYSDVVRAHDAIDELKRAQDEERRAMWDKAAEERRKKEEEKRIKIDEKRKKYEYEDDTYIIRLPIDSNEIVREGNMQRICIGGYTTRHAFGETSLFFLRRKSEPTVPFYAIEMNNNNVIVQIHGYANKWCGNNPEVIPTLVRWLRKNGIKCDQKILTCKARGYCSTNDYVPMPVVD